MTTNLANHIDGRATEPLDEQQLAVDQPDFGPILDRWLVPNGRTVSTAELIAPRVEAEIAFILTRLGLSPGPSDVVQA